MIPLTQAQLSEIQQILGCDPSSEGEWSLTPPLGACTYAINSKGTYVIRMSCVDRAGRSQKPKICQIREYYDDYLFCNLSCRDIRLHRLMAATWLPDWDETLTVNHKDGNKHNNDYHNLEMMTVHDNCMYYHNSECISEQRLKDYAHHGDTIRGRIHITNGVEARMVNPDEDIPEGWWRGRPQSMRDKESMTMKGRPSANANKRSITDGVSVRYINNDEVIPDGWHLGGLNHLTDESMSRLSSAMLGRIYIHKGTENKRVYRHELDSYLLNGWTKGMYAEHLDSSNPKNKEFREAMRIKMTGSNNPMFGKHLTPEAKAQLSASNSGRRHTEEAKQKMRQAKLGYHHTPEAKQKMSDAMKGRPPANKGRIWITDGIRNKQIPEEELCNYPGYTKGVTRDRIERTYVNDGVINHKIPINELDDWLADGYVRGLLRSL